MLSEVNFYLALFISVPMIVVLFVYWRHYHVVSERLAQDYNVIPLRGVWYVFQHGYKRAGPFDSNAAGWDWVDMDAKRWQWFGGQEVKA